MLFDSGVVDAVVQTIPSWGVILLLLFSYLGSVYVIGPGIMLAYLAARTRSLRTRANRVSGQPSWIANQYRWSWPVLVLGAYGLFVALKPLFGTARPGVDGPITAEALPPVAGVVYERAVNFSTGSFPSGHAIAATVFWGLLAVDLRVSTARRRLIVATLIIAAIGFSRIGLGVHFIGDVVAGIGIGLCFLLAGLHIRRRIADPMSFLVVVGGIPTVAGIFTGRVLDASILLALLVVTGFVLRSDKANIVSDTDPAPTT